MGAATLYLRLILGHALSQGHVFSLGVSLRSRFIPVFQPWACTVLREKALPGGHHKAQDAISYLTGGLAGIPQVVSVGYEGGEGYLCSLQPSVSVLLQGG
jgi:hypothetical protein